MKNSSKMRIVSSSTISFEKVNAQSVDEYKSESKFTIDAIGRLSEKYLGNVSLKARATASSNVNLEPLDQSNCLMILLILLLMQRLDYIMKQ